MPGMWLDDSTACCMVALHVLPSCLYFLTWTMFLELLLLSLGQNGDSIGFSVGFAKWRKGMKIMMLETRVHTLGIVVCHCRHEVSHDGTTFSNLEWHHACWIFLQFKTQPKTAFPHENIRQTKNWHETLEDRIKLDQQKHPVSASTSHQNGLNFIHAQQTLNVAAIHHQEGDSSNPNFQGSNHCHHTSVSSNYCGTAAAGLWASAYPNPKLACLQNYNKVQYIYILKLTYQVFSRSKWIQAHPPISQAISQFVTQKVPKNGKHQIFPRFSSRMASTHIPKKNVPRYICRSDHTRCLPRRCNPCCSLAVSHPRLYILPFLTSLLVASCLQWRHQWQQHKEVTKKGSNYTNKAQTVLLDSKIQVSGKL